MQAGRVLGPFSLRPSGNLRTTGLGVVPKKNGKWRVIFHLSTPEGHSVNDFISREEFTLHYSTIDGAVLTSAGSIEEPSWLSWTCRQHSTWSHSWPPSGSSWECTGGVNITWTPTTPLAYTWPPASSITLPPPCTGSWSTTMELPS